MRLMRTKYLKVLQMQTRTFTGETLAAAIKTAEDYMKEWLAYQDPHIDGHCQKNGIYFVTVKYGSLD
jgi:hypothetical protein